MYRPPYPMYLYSRSASRPPYPIYLYAGSVSRPPYPIYLCAGSASRPPYPIYLYAGSASTLVVIVSKHEYHSRAVKMETIPFTPSRLVYIITDATVRDLKHSKNNSKKTKGNPPTGSKPFVLSGLADRYASTSKALASKRAKKQNQRRLTYLLGQKPSVPYTRWIGIFSGVANRYASTSKALARVIKFRYSLQAAPLPAISSF